MTSTILLACLSCLLLGGILGAALSRLLLSRGRTDASRLATDFAALSAQALERNNRSFLDLAGSTLREAGVRATGELEARRQAVEHLVAPLTATLAKVEAQLQALESARVGAYAQLTEQVRAVAASSEHLRGETASLVAALRTPQAGGRWGEMHLRRVVEIAGMVDRCDFTEQVATRTGEGGQRPDMLVQLAGAKCVVVDAKVSVAAYLDAANCAEPAGRDALLRTHARHLRAHVDSLAAKAYWEQLPQSPEFVVLFVPGEAFLAPALGVDPDLLEYAARKRVVIATPTTLIALLRTVAYAWQQERLSENAAAVFAAGRELHGRLAVFGEHLDKLGRSLTGAVGAFNQTVGSLESRVLPSARRLSDLQGLDTVLTSPPPQEVTPRPVSAPELLQSRSP